MIYSRKIFVLIFAMLTFFVDADGQARKTIREGIDEISGKFDVRFVYDSSLDIEKTYRGRTDKTESLKEIMTGEGPLCFWKNDMIKEDENGREYYVVYLYRLSEELYTAYDHFIHQDTDVLGHMGLSPVHYRYTNVKGGFGVLGGISESTVTIPLE